MFLDEIVDASHIYVKERDVMLETMCTALGIHGERNRPPSTSTKMVIEWS